MPARPNQLRALYASTTVSSVGDGVLTAALPLLAATDSSPMAVAVVAGAAALPWMLVGPFAGVLVDRWPRRTTFIAVDSVRGVILLALATIEFYADLPTWLLACAAFLMTAGQTFSDATSQALVAQVAHASSEDLNRVNGRILSLENVSTNLAGPPLGSVLFSIGHGFPLLVDAISFALSARIAAALPRGKAEQHQRTGLLRELRDGVRFLFNSRTLRRLCVLNALYNFSYYIPFGVFILFLREDLGVSDFGFGVMLSSGAVGGIAGGWFAASLLSRIPRTAGIVLCLLSQAAAWPLVAMSNSFVASCVLFAVVGASGSLFTVIVVSARQVESPDQLLGRVVTAFRIVGQGASPLGAVAGGLLATNFGLTAPFAVASIVTACSAALAVLWKNPTHRDKSHRGEPVVEQA